MSEPETPAPTVRFEEVDIVFGDRPEKALPLLDQGKSREEIQEATGQVLGVAGASLDVAEGELLVLMGLSGSGKSTLLRAVNGLNPVIRGRTLVRSGDDYVDPAKASSAVLRRLRRERISMVFQQFALLPWRTVADNVALGLELSGYPRAKRRERVDDQLALVGLSEWADRRVGELSGGMQQRVGLARAFATDAPILLMDEPFSALDPLIRNRLQDELLAVQEKLNRTIIFVSHDLDEAAKIGSRIAIMEGGRVIQVGTPQEIVQNPSTEYVQDFVAHMNPLNVLRAVDVMVPCEPGKTLAELPGGQTCAPEVSVRDVIDMRLGRPAPIYVVPEPGTDANACPLGVIAEPEILACLSSTARAEPVAGPDDRAAE